jgi:hypothetical protein
MFGHLEVTKKRNNWHAIMDTYICATTLPLFHMKDKPINTRIIMGLISPAKFLDNNMTHLIA